MNWNRKGASSGLIEVEPSWLPILGWPSLIFPRPTWAPSFSTRGPNLQRRRRSDAVDMSKFGTFGHDSPTNPKASQAHFLHEMGSWYWNTPVIEEHVRLKKISFQQITKVLTLATRSKSVNTKRFISKGWLYKRDPIQTGTSTVKTLSRKLLVLVIFQNSWCFIWSNLVTSLSAHVSSIHVLVCRS